MQLSKLKNLLGLKFLALIVLDNIINKPKNQLVKKNARLNKLFFIILGKVFINDLVQNAANMILYSIDNWFCIHYYLSK